MFKFKHIKILEQLLLESELIVVGNEISDIINMSKGKGKEEDLYAKIDALLAQMIENDVLNKAKADPGILEELSNAFLNSEWTSILKRYINFISQIVESETRSLQELIENDASEDDIEVQKARLRAYKGRLGVVYQAYNSIEEAKWTAEVRELMQEIEKIKGDQAKTETEVLTKLVDFTSSRMGNTDDVKAATSTAIQVVQIAYEWTSDQGEEPEINISGEPNQKQTTEPDIEYIPYEEIKSDDDKAAEKLKEENEALKKKLVEISQDFNKRTGGQAQSLGKRDVIIRTAIEELRTWQEINTLESQFSKVRTTIMTDEIDEIDPATGNRIAVVKLDAAAKRAYIQLATDAYLEAKARLGGFKVDLDVNRYQGVSYTPEINLPLYSKTLIPITSKQMADASRIQYLFKALNWLGSMLPTIDYPGKEQKAMGEQALRMRAAILPVIGRTVSKAARKLGGKEAQLKAEKWTRILFTSKDSGLDQPKSQIKNTMPGSPGTKVRESEGAPPGVALQVPGSIGGQGNPVAPTQSSIGSGDNFQPKTKGKNIKSFDHFLKGLKK